jgi:hypothetical protein
MCGDGPVARLLKRAFGVFVALILGAGLLQRRDRGDHPVGHGRRRRRGLDPEPDRQAAWRDHRAPDNNGCRGPDAPAGV